MYPTEVADFRIFHITEITARTLFFHKNSMFDLFLNECWDGTISESICGERNGNPYISGFWTFDTREYVSVDQIVDKLLTE